ncbi:MAG: hypothetical protein RCH30_3060 [Candidatus Phytoplasma australasiaticum]|uniref:Uncharacterized protein n=1 Tax=Candidatus Phytoplasma australasiaticum subsp. australasiaticum TaxID=2832407 RepID=A0AAP4X8Q8_9MOLU|nr:hypothetical protein [Candidatus Phytoplasma australasiaticum]QLL36885.1 hypothetical protein EPWB_v2c2820 ['Echinacea purpurea' witches'-broom phytoplasma]WEX20460.1 MAG: hypothetical protein TB2022_3810 [Candidatus Phytoplasma aurantifolia]MDO8054729.1 hypothetical protein [Candidatus Phytoplasma australasiaticum]WKV64133.1 MAG: hypothetical protein NCHU2022_c2830 [Candidatus Phytoplasma australasiaticum]WMW50192.1 MAG: hypothetical protein RCH30_3060 [Candidatus Phytoplasma australasiati
MSDAMIEIYRGTYFKDRSNIKTTIYPKKKNKKRSTKKVDLEYN